MNKLSSNKKERKISPLHKNRINIVSSNFSELNTGNQELISTENRELKSNQSTEIHIHKKRSIKFKQIEIHKTNNYNELETISDNLQVQSKNKQTIDFADEEDDIAMPNKIIYEKDKNLEETYEEK